MSEEIFKNTDYPEASKDLKGNQEHFSKDVFTVDELGLMNVAYWNYDDKKWSFHTDTLIDPYEDGELIDFVWMYKPKYLIA